MSQNDVILTHLCRGRTVTRLEALFNWGVQNITARIVDLRDAGVEVHTSIKKDPQGREYAAYKLSAEARDGALKFGWIKKLDRRKNNAQYALVPGKWTKVGA